MLNISDFAKDLLFGMKFGIGERGEELRLGAVGILHLLLYHFLFWKFREPHGVLKIIGPSVSTDSS